MSSPFTYKSGSTVLDDYYKMENMSNIEQFKYMQQEYPVVTQPTTQQVTQNPSVFNQQQVDTNPFVGKQPQIGLKQINTGNGVAMVGQLPAGMTQAQIKGAGLDWNQYNPETGAYVGSRDLNFGEKYGGTMQAIGTGMGVLNTGLNMASFFENRKTARMQRELLGEQTKEMKEEYSRIKNLRAKLNKQYG